MKHPTHLLVPPLPTYHLDHSNHWESRYGNRWREEIDKSSLMSNYTSICSLLHHIIREGERIFGGTEREGDWVFYHDALSTMTAKKTVEWMKTEFVKGNSGPTYHDKWMKPVLNITLDSRHYVGNQPEKMPMDNSLNEDQNLAVDRHVILSRVLSNDPDDPLTFFLATRRSKIANTFGRHAVQLSNTGERLCLDSLIGGGTGKRRIIIMGGISMVAKGRTWL